MKKNTLSKLKKVSSRQHSQHNKPEFLSEQEVDALLSSVMDDDSFSFESDVEPGVQEYNLGTQERIIRGRMPTLELINERFAREFRIAFFDRFKRTSEISVGPVRVQKYSAFIRNLVVPTNINIINFNTTLPGAGLIVFDPNLIFLTVDTVFGGDGRFHCRVEGRQFTQIETMVIRELFDVFVRCYTQSFHTVYPLDINYVRSEYNSQFASVATPFEIVVSTTFTVEISGACADMHVCVPYASYEKIIKILQSTLTPDIIGHNTNVGVPIQHIPHTLKIMAECGPGYTIADIRKLQSGDFIPLQNFNAYIEDKHLFEGEYSTNKFTITNTKEN